MRAHQPGSTPIDIPETVPNPAHTPAPAPAPERAPTKAPEKVPEKVIARSHPGLWRAFAAAGRRTEALCTLTEGLEFRDRFGEGWLDSELWRLKGEILEPEKVEAIEYFVRAVDLARRNGTKLLELPPDRLRRTY